MENIKHNVNEIKSQIKTLEEELNKIQGQCDHPNVVLKYDDNSKSVLKICNICEKVIGYPTTEELKNSDYL